MKHIIIGIIIALSIILFYLVFIVIRDRYNNYKIQNKKTNSMITSKSRNKRDDIKLSVHDKSLTIEKYRPLSSSQKQLIYKWLSEDSFPQYNIELNEIIKQYGYTNGQKEILNKIRDMYMIRINGSISKPDIRPLGSHTIDNC